MTSCRRIAPFAAAVIACACGSSSTPGGAWAPGQPLTLDVSATFPAGTVVRDQYSGASATVDASGKVTITPDLSGVALLEKDGAAATPFRWSSATVYYAMTDRFFNGDTANDHSYGRKSDGAQEIGTWHGGDWKGLTLKLDYLASLGVTALWISPIVEQVHGWVSGGAQGEFKHYGYHGYWALDFTRLDANFGNEAELKALIDAAHARGIRVLVDVVINHPGYATGADLVSYVPEVFKDGTGAAFTAYDAASQSNYATWNDLVNYSSTKWVNWWDERWIRAGFPFFPTPDNNDPLKASLTFLPDFVTEDTVPLAPRTDNAASITYAAGQGTPTLFRRAGGKSDTGVVDVPGYTVRDYLVKWQTDWVRKFGIDGFRCDTAKNVDLASWKALKTAGLGALQDWKTANPTAKLDDAPFWMTGEVFSHGPNKDPYFTDGGFDSLINFAFQGKALALLTANASLAAGQADLEEIYSTYAGFITADASFDFLSYISSHDTALFYESFAAAAGNVRKQQQAGTALLLTPGGVQIFYGDESGRRFGPSGSDPNQGTRSDMNFASTDASILGHWTKLANFRKRHAAVGSGAHLKLASPDGTYVFSRKLGTDAVVVVIATPG